MNRRVLFSMLSLAISSLLVTGSISLAQSTQPALALSQSVGSIVSGWEQVNNDGFGDANNLEIIRLAVYGDYLFASTENQNTGGEVWRSTNGTEWDQVNVGGFGVVTNTIAFVEGVFNGYLYVGICNSVTGAEIWRCVTCDGSDWTPVVSHGFDDPNNHTVQRIMVFSDTLYATTDNGVTGVEVWKSPTGDAGSWVQSNTDGFGNSENTGAWAAAAFDDHLYVASAVAGDWAPPDAFGVEVWRTNGDDNWTKVTPEGFGERENVAWDLTVARGELYLSLGNFSGAQIWRCVTCDGSDWEQVIDGDLGLNAFATVVFEYQNQLIAATTNNWSLELSIELNGIDVWRSEDGSHWTQISRLGFGDPYNRKVGAGAMVEYKGLLYLGIQNRETGAELWRWLKQVYLPLVLKAEDAAVQTAVPPALVDSAAPVSIAGSCFAGAHPYSMPPAGHHNFFASGFLSVGIYQGLMELPLFNYRWAEGEYIPTLGESYEIILPDTLVVHLREGVTWSDGSSFGAHDVLSHFRLRRLLNATVWTYLSDVIATDSWTVTFIMQEPSAAAIRRILREYISPASVYGGLAEQAQALFDAGKTPADQEWIDLLAELQAFRPTKRVVTGPYKIALEDVGDSFLTMHKVVTSAWASSAKFDCVRLYNGETPVIAPLVLAQEIDYATHGFSPETEQAFRDAGIRILRPPIFSGAALLVNMAIHPFEMVEVRQALAYAIDMDQTAAASLGESAKRQDYMTGVSDNLINTWLTGPQLDEMERYAYDPAQATTLLSGLGFTRSLTDNIWVTDLGHPMVYTLTYPAEYADWAGAAHDVAQQLSSFGISVTLKGVPFMVHPVQVDAGEFQMAIRGWGAGDPHPYESFRTAFFTHNSAAMSSGDPGLPGINYTLQRVVTDSVQIDIEQMILDCPKGLDLESQKQRVYDLAWVFNRELPKIPLWERYGNNPIGVGERVVGWPPDDDPIYKNSPYADSFVIMMLLDGTLYPSLAQTYLEPGQPATLVYTSPTGSTTAVQVPSSTMTETIELVYAQVEAPLPALPEMAFAGTTFELTAYRDSVLLAGDAISGPITVTITYNDADIANIDESTLLLYRYVCSGPETSLLCVWEEIGTRPGEGQTLDTENNILTAWLTGLSRFSGMGVRLEDLRFSVFLPLVLRNWP